MPWYYNQLLSFFGPHPVLHFSILYAYENLDVVCYIPDAVWCWTQTLSLRKSSSHQADNNNKGQPPKTERGEMRACLTYSDRPWSLASPTPSVSPAFPKSEPRPLLLTPTLPSCTLFQPSHPQTTCLDKKNSQLPVLDAKILPNYLCFRCDFNVSPHGFASPSAPHHFLVISKKRLFLCH